MDILLGTHNRDKIREIKHLLSDLPLNVRTLDDFPKIGEVEEDGETLEENAIKKAHLYSKASGLLTLADDTGLEVAALNGEPGIYSARYAGENCTYADNVNKLLQRMSELKDADRSARFRCIIAISDAKQGLLKTVEGFVEGSIYQTPRGKNGFGYDPVFYIPTLKKTMAEMTLEEKNRYSHRALALARMKEVLKEDLKA